MVTELDRAAPAALTGLRARVGNYAGVTVERKEGRLTTASGKALRVLDLPGAYSLNPRSPDEQVTADVLFGQARGEKRPDLAVCVVDATNLRRHLRLVLAVMRQGLPVVVALNMADLADKRGQPVDAAALSQQLGVLRNDLKLNGPKYGCGLGQCGACTVLVDGVAARACVIPVGGVKERQITTLEGLGDSRVPHPVQQAFIDAQAAQCGYCLNGMIMSTAALLAQTPQPTEAQAQQALAGNLCRCGTHVEIMRAVMRAADLLAESRSDVQG